MKKNTGLQDVKNYWENEACGSRYSSSRNTKTYFDELEKARYEMESWIPDFAGFCAASGKRILEIGVGTGIDFSNWVRNGAIPFGIDLTELSVDTARRCLESHDIGSGCYKLSVADVENLPFKNYLFDIVYSYGVLHHTPNIRRALRESIRVLKSGGEFKAMLYHVPSWTGWMLWFWHFLIKGEVTHSVKQAILEHLESPRTKSFTADKAYDLIAQAGFKNIRIRTKLGPSDLLCIKPSGRFNSIVYRIIWKIYPRWFIKLLGDRFGIELLIEANKP